ncbi:hypothetical protein [Streptomyces sp. NPDC001843]|uniref:hypothetical protein n=1 Tax=Streptomyces sp. NPDC001843 TaxID=3364617 RepID=UPI0036BF6162
MNEDPGMNLDPALIGSWSSHPFDAGAMEVSELEFHGDGQGAGTVSSAAGDEVTWFRWCCPAPGVLEVRTAEGDTGQHRYAVAPAVPAGASDPVTTVAFDEAVFFAHRYARTGYPG